MSVLQEYEGIPDVPGLDTSLPVDTASLRGTTALVTGGASGLGRAYCEALAVLGVFVGCVDLNAEGGAETVKNITEKGGLAVFAKADMTSWDDQLAAFKLVLSMSPTGRIQLVIANAGIFPPDGLAVLDDPDRDPVEPNFISTKVNLLGTMLTTKLANHYFQRNPEGEDRCLILKSSVAGYVEVPNFPQYNVSKWGVRGLFYNMRASHLSSRFNLVAPWTIRSGIMDDETLDALEKVTDLADIKDAVACILFIASRRDVKGKAFTVIPRSFHPHGFLDIAADDSQGSPIVKMLQDRANRMFGGS